MQRFVLPLLHSNNKKVTTMKKQVKKDTRKTISSKITKLTSSLTNRTKAEVSVKELIQNGSTTTGTSGYSKGYARKDVWTLATYQLAKQLGLSVEMGNRAPRGGANGEYVSLVADRRKNKLVHQFHALVERKRAIDDVRALRNAEAEAAALAAKNAEFMAEFGKYKTFILENQSRFLELNAQAGYEKGLAVTALLKECLQAAGVERSVDFYRIFKDAIRLIQAERNAHVVAEIEEKRRRCEETGETFVTQEMFHKRTGACYKGIRGFLMQKYGTDQVEGLPLSEALEIMPESYRQRFVNPVA